MTRNHRRSAPAAGPATPDAAVREIVRLLGLVAEEERVLARLERCVVELNAVARARAALTGCTRSELAEAQTWATAGGRSVEMLPVSEEEEVPS